MSIFLYIPKPMEIMELSDPYNITYKGIYAVADKKNETVEIMEQSSCYSGSA